MRHLACLVALAAALMPTRAVALDPTPSPSPASNAPSVDRPVIQGANATSDVSRMSVAPSLGAPHGTLARQLGDLGAGKIFVDSGGIMSGLGGATIAGKPGSALFVRPALNFADGTALYSGSSDFSTPRTLELIASKIALSPTNGIDINLKPGAPGIRLNALGPLTTATRGALHFNGFFNDVNAPITGTPDSADSVNCQCVTNLQSSLAVGPNFTGVEAYGGSFGVVTYGNTNTISDLVGLASGVSQNYTGISRIYGGNTGVTLGPKGTSPFVLGHEVDVTVNNPKSTPYRAGYNALNTGSYRGTIVDGALTVGCGGSTALKGGCFKHAIAFYTGDAPGVPNTEPLNDSLANDGDIIWFERAQTLANVLNMSNIKVTGTILNFPGVILTGAGKFITSGLDLYAAAPSVPSGHVGYGGTTVAASKCGSLPGSTGCLVINVGGTQRYVPYY